MIKTVRIKFDKLLGQTSRAYLLKINGAEMWFPSRFCRNFIINKKLGGNTVIPAWLFKEKFGYEPEESEAETIIIHHVPELIEKVMSNEIEELKNE
jgi:hypothetical protein